MPWIDLRVGSMDAGGRGGMGGLVTTHNRNENDPIKTRTVVKSSSLRVSS